MSIVQERESNGNFSIGSYTLDIVDRMSRDDLCTALLTYLLIKGPASTSASKEFELYTDLAQLLSVSESYLTAVCGSRSAWVNDCRNALLALKAQKLVKFTTIKRGRVLKYTKWYLTDTGKIVAETLTAEPSTI